MSNNNDTPGMAGFDADAFGLPTGAGGNTAAGFMYGDSDLEVDANDPLYAATVEAMKARGIEIPAPGEEPRPPAMPTEGDGETPPQGTPPPETPRTPDAPADETPEFKVEDDEPPAPDFSAPPADEPPVEPPADEPPADDTPALAFKVDGQDVSLNAEQGEYLLRVNTWLENIPDEVKTQWAGIESGTHVAITAQEYQDLQARAQTPPPTQQRPPRAPDIDSLDDDTIDYIRSLEAQVTPAQSGPSADQPQQQPQQYAPGTQQQPQQDTAELQAAFRHQEQQRTAMMQELATTNEQYKTQYGLTDEQVNRLEQVTSDMAIIPRLSQQMTQYSPTGQVIRQAPFGEVVARAYDVAMSQDPTLREIRDEMIYNARVAQDAQRNQATNTKKAKAGTLASTPSAAVPANGKGPQVSPDNKMDLQATSSAIADALSKLQAQS